MDVFRLHSQLIADYSTYIRSFITISDERIGKHVVWELEDGALWPDRVPNTDPESSLRWLAGSALGILGGSKVVQSLATFLTQEKSAEARQEATKALRRIADNPGEDAQVRKMAEQAISL